MDTYHFPTSVEQWDIWELSVPGPETGNPFIEQQIFGEFYGENEHKTVRGFYDGDGVYRLRFMPAFSGTYHFIVRTSFREEICGTFGVTSASGGNHGPVRVSSTWHFAYEDGTSYYCLGTTCYVWELQSYERIQETLKSLKDTCFNKIRFCIFPKHYIFNLVDPLTFPYEGTPMDAQILTEENFHLYSGKSNGSCWDFTRFCCRHFQQVEYAIGELMKLGIEADLILLHPYDRWGFSCMKPEEDDLYFKYAIARFSAFRNVWWSLANEYDFMYHKAESDWERLARIICEEDPYGHLRSIHNGRQFYDYRRPWITHCSIQRQEAVLSAEHTDEWRKMYQKPVVLDEICYEGNLMFGWGNISGRELVRRFWEGFLRGGYPGHGETLLSPDEVLWWSHGGKLKGESWKRFRFLYDIIASVPGRGIAPYDFHWEYTCGTPESEQECKVKSWYLLYFGFKRPAYMDFFFEDNVEFEIHVIDTWNMSIEPAGIGKGNFRVLLPGREYMCIRLMKKKGV